MLENPNTVFLLTPKNDNEALRTLIKSSGHRIKRSTSIFTLIRKLMTHPARAVILDDECTPESLPIQLAQIKELTTAPIYLLTKEPDSTKWRLWESGEISIILIKPIDMTRARAAMSSLLKRPSRTARA